MKPILVHLDDYTAKLLNKVAPGKGRKRSKFIRDAVLRALMDLAEEETRRAYERHIKPQDDAWLHQSVWAPSSEAIHPTPAQQRALDRLGQRLPNRQLQEGGVWAYGSMWAPASEAIHPTRAQRRQLDRVDKRGAKKEPARSRTLQTSLRAHGGDANTKRVSRPPRKRR